MWSPFDPRKELHGDKSAKPVGRGAFRGVAERTVTYGAGLAGTGTSRYEDNGITAAKQDVAAKDSERWRGRGKHGNPHLAREPEGGSRDARVSLGSRRETTRRSPPSRSSDNWREDCGGSMRRPTWA